MGAVKERAVVPAMALVASAWIGALAAHLAGAEALDGAAIASASMLIVAAVAWDLRSRRIPNAWTYPGLILGLALGFLGGVEAGTAAIAGTLVAGGLFSLIAVASRGGLGVGDVKLGAALGAFVGPVGAIDLVLVTAVAGGVIGIAWLLAGHGRRDSVPYAPALAAGGWIALAAIGPVVA